MGKAEEWRDVKGYEGFYQVSNLGRVRSVTRQIKRDNGSYMKHGQELILRLDQHGYFQVNLAKNKAHRIEKVHRLVANAFIENPYNKPEVNHKDCNPQNNRVDNLEWCTHYENMRYMHEQGRAKRTDSWLENLHESQKKFYKPVIATHIETGEVLRFDNLNEVTAAGFQPSCVCHCCKGKRKQHKGYRFEYAKELTYEKAF